MANYALLRIKQFGTKQSLSAPLISIPSLSRFVAFPCLSTIPLSRSLLSLSFILYRTNPVSTNGSHHHHQRIVKWYNYYLSSFYPVFASLLFRMGKSSTGNSYYWVARGHRPGIYQYWTLSSSSSSSPSSTSESSSSVASSIIYANDAVKGYPNNLYAKCKTLTEAINKMIENGAQQYINNGPVQVPLSTFASRISVPSTSNHTTVAVNNSNNSTNNSSVTLNQNIPSSLSSSTFSSALISAVSSSSSIPAVAETNGSLPAVPNPTAKRNDIDNPQRQQKPILPTTTMVSNSIIPSTVIVPTVIDLTGDKPGNNGTTTIHSSATVSRKRARNGNENEDNNVTPLVEASSITRTTPKPTTIEQLVPTVVDAVSLVLPITNARSIHEQARSICEQAQSQPDTKRSKITVNLATGQLPRTSIPPSILYPSVPYNAAQQRYFSTSTTLSSSSSSHSSSSSSNDTYLLQFDGGSRGNPGIGGCGSLLYKLRNDWETTTVGKSVKYSFDHHLLYTESHPSSSSSSFVTTDGESIPDTYKELVWRYGRYFPGPISNNQAEYAGLYIGILAAQTLGIRRLLIEGDSDLIIKQVCGKYMCTKDHLRIFVTEIQKLLGVYVASSSVSAVGGNPTSTATTGSSTSTTGQRILPSSTSSTTFDYVTLRHIFRTHNSHADSLANEAMDNRDTVCNYTTAGGSSNTGGNTTTLSSSNLPNENILFFNPRLEHLLK